MKDELKKELETVIAKLYIATTNDNCKLSTVENIQLTTALNTVTKVYNNLGNKDVE